MPDSAYPFADLCGCGVAFKLAWQVCKTFGDGKKASPHLRDFLMKSIALVAMATVADVMPIHGENRILVRQGLAGLADSPSLGLRALMSVSGCLGKKGPDHGDRRLRPSPRGSTPPVALDRAMQAVEMLTTDDGARADELAQALDLCNKQRQEVERRIVEEAHEVITASGGMKDRGAIIVGREGWHPGVIGIVASRLVDTYHRPAVVVALGPDHGQASARSVPGFDLYAALHACSAGLTAFGGHSMAAGLRFPRAHFDDFSRLFDEPLPGSPHPPSRSRRPCRSTPRSPLGLLTLKVVEAIEALEPHGIGNPRPVLVANGVRVSGAPKPCGERQNHLRIRFSQGDRSVAAIGWNLAERGKALTDGTVCSVAFHPSINEWNGRRDVQLEIKDFRIEGEAQSA